MNHIAAAAAPCQQTGNDNPHGSGSSGCGITTEAINGVAQATLPVAASEPISPVPLLAPPQEEGEKAGEVTIIVTAQPGTIPTDPLQGVNAFSFAAVQAIDDAFVGPVAMSYKSVVPSPVRSGLRNFLNNVQEPIIFLNFVLQLKPKRAVETAGRFAINSTVGAAGLMDIAKRRGIDLPRRPNGFAYTLGYYGVKPGPFLYLPFIGPTSVRDVTGRVIDLSLLPAAVGEPLSHPAYALSSNTIRALDDRAESDEKFRKFREELGGYYEASRNDYHVKRQAEIDALRGEKGKGKGAVAK